MNFAALLGRNLRGRPQVFKLPRARSSQTMPAGATREAIRLMRLRLRGQVDDQIRRR